MFKETLGGEHYFDKNVNYEQTNYRLIFSVFSKFSDILLKCKFHEKGDFIFCYQYIFECKNTYACSWICNSIESAANFLSQDVMRKAQVWTVSNDTMNFRQLKYVLMLWQQFSEI